MTKKIAPILLECRFYLTPTSGEKINSEKKEKKKNNEELNANGKWKKGG